LGSLIGTRLVGENPELFVGLVLANDDLLLMTEETNLLYIPYPVVVNPKLNTFREIVKHWLKGLPDMFQVWILFCLWHTHNFLGGVMQVSSTNELGDR